jgi:tripartite-type tricarboxylate transporter receptor subunit TctC
MLADNPVTLSFSRRALALTGVAAAALTVAPRSFGQARAGSGVLTVLVPQPAGGVTDAFARAVAPALARRLGRVAMVENVVGASGSRAAQRLLASAPDGATLLVGSASETVLAPLTLRAVRYRAGDFRLLGLINDSPLALYARGDLPANDLDQLVALARQRAGGARGAEKSLSYGSTGQGSLFHLVTETLLSATGIGALHVPYRGGLPLLTDLQSGAIDFALLPVDALLAGMVAGGRMKVLGVTSARRLDRFPAAATLDESQAAPAFGRPHIWVGLMASAAIDATTAARLHQAVAAALSDDDARKAIAAAGGEVPPALSPAAAARRYAADSAALQALAKAARVEPA